MSIAAVPGYLGKNFETASPGMRFGMYLPIWTSREDQEKAVRKRASKRSPEGREVQQYLDERGMEATIAWLQQRDRNPLEGLWSKNKFAADQAWKTICALTPADIQRMRALAERQQALKNTLPPEAVLSHPAESTAPFTTGLGNEHPLENGFSFLWPYGLPYLPGSGVKGVVRQAARELAEGLWGETRDWSNEKAFQIKVGKELIELSVIDLLFGLESKDGAKEHFRGVLTFWDVIPLIKGNQLMVEIMTPHQKHYYQDGEPPHDSGQPTPISFLTVPPGSKFAFHVVCDRAFLRRLAPGLAEDDRWRTLLAAAFEHAFDWLGFGAKTAVGYGALRIDPEIERRRREEVERRRVEEEQRRKEEEAAREAEARRRAFEALPPSEQARARLEKALGAFPAEGPLDKDRYSELLAHIKPHLDAAQTWQESERHALADYLEGIFNRLGWCPSGLKKDKRKKQEKKRRELLENLKKGTLP